MKTFSSNIRWLGAFCAFLVAFVAIATLLVTNGVFARSSVPPVNTSVIYACVVPGHGNENNELSLTTANAICPNKEQKISWNQQSPAGSSSPPQGFASSSNGTVNIPTGSQTPVSVAQIAIPASAGGNYVVTAYASVTFGPASAQVSCVIASSNATFLPSNTPAAVLAGPFLGQSAPVASPIPVASTLTQTAEVSLPSGGTVSFNCISYPNTSSAFSAGMTAMKVA